MGNQLQKLNCSHHPRHHHDNDDVYEPDRKRQKGNRNELTTVKVPVEPKSITDICYDCLERILDFLDLQSLLHVADTCTWLRAAAAMKFGTNFRQKRIYLDLQTYAQPWIHVHRNEINLSGLRVCLPFLRCFGEKITDLAVNYRNSDGKITGQVDRYINQYCGNLISISQVNRAFPITNLQKPFKNVEKIDITSSCLGKYLPKFTYLFPNLGHLEMYYVSFYAFQNVCFPNLKHLTLIVENSNRWQYFTYENTAKFLNVHRKLDVLNLMLFGEMALSTLLRLISGNRCITKLSVVSGLGYSDKFVNVNVDEMDRFAAKHPLLVELDVVSFRFTADNAVRFIGQMTSLKLFKFQVENSFERDCLFEQLDDEWKYHFWTFNGIFYIKLNRGKINKMNEFLI